MGKFNKKLKLTLIETTSEGCEESMLSYRDSDFFQLMDKGNSFLLKLKKSIAEINESNKLNDKLSVSINQLKKVYKDTIVMKVVEAIKNREIVLVYFTPEYQFHEFFPYVKGRDKSGKDIVIIDVSRIVNIERDATDTIIAYTVDNINKFYSMLVPAYLSLKLFHSNDILPSEAMKYLSQFWGRMFCNVLLSNQVGIIQNDREKQRAFMYFAMKFFMIYYLQAPDAIVNNIANSYLEGDYGQYLSFVMTNIKNKDVNLYSNFNNFLAQLFDDSITKIRTTHSRVTGSINISYFLKIFRNMYGTNALMGLCSADYFLYIVFNSFNKSNYIRDKGFEKVIIGNRGEFKRDVPKMLDSLYREL